MPTKEITLPELMTQFGSEDACHEAMEDMRWPDGVECPRCGSKAISRIKKRRQFDCDGCRYQFSVRVGTIFQRSKLPLSIWFLAVYLMVESRKSVSANQIKRMLGITYKTAWLLCHKIREAMFDEDAVPLEGIVEVDETWIGGKRKGVGSGSHHPHLTVVIGAVSRDGEARLSVVPDRKKRTLHRFVKANVSPKAKAIHTDEWRPYRGIGSKGTPHRTVNHHKGEWVNGNVHANTIEGVWSLLDRSIIGAYHKVSKKHLPAYLHEIEWRYNNRNNPYLFRDTIMELLECEPMEYKKLTA